MHTAKTVLADVRVPLRGGEVSMSEQLLDDPKIRTAVEQVRGE